MVRRRDSFFSFFVCFGDFQRGVGGGGLGYYGGGWGQESTPFETVKRLGDEDGKEIPFLLVREESGY